MKNALKKALHRAICVLSQLFDPLLVFELKSSQYFGSTTGTATTGYQVSIDVFTDLYESIPNSPYGMREQRTVYRVVGSVSDDAPFELRQATTLELSTVLTRGVLQDKPVILALLTERYVTVLRRRLIPT